MFTLNELFFQNDSHQTKVIIMAEDRQKSDIKKPRHSLTLFISKAK